MAINAIKYQTVIEAKIRASSAKEFADDLETIRRIPERDRHFDPNKKVWVISHPEAYQDIPFVKKALDNAAMYVPML